MLELVILIGTTSEDWLHIGGSTNIYHFHCTNYILTYWYLFICQSCLRNDFVIASSSEGSHFECFVLIGEWAKQRDTMQWCQIGNWGYLLGVDNAKSGICYMYVWMVCMPLKRVGGVLFSPKNTAFQAWPLCLLLLQH